jgi:lichenan operon transcriptional antiterminator
LHLGGRTGRYGTIAYIISVLHMVLIVSQNKKGYQLTDYDRAMEIMTREGNGIPVLPEERINYILRPLFFEVEY